MKPENKKRYRLNFVEIHDESQPGNPTVAVVGRLDDNTLALKVLQHFNGKDGEQPVPFLSTRSALELAAALIQVAIGQRFSVPESVALPKPSCARCGSEADLDVAGVCPACREVSP
jgi:hypothetical protein